MKKITTILALVGTLTLGLAADATIDAQIERIQNAPAAEKVKLMNEFKQQLMTMNKEQRQEAVTKMQVEMQAAGEMTQAKIQEGKQLRKDQHVRKDQAKATNEMVRDQYMNQKQIGSQMGYDIANTVSDGNVQQGGNTQIQTHSF